MKNLLIAALLLFATIAEGQTRRRTFRQREIGFFGGASYYLGDINPRRHFMANHPAFGAYFRYTTNYRYAWRFGVNYGRVSAADAASGEADQIERGASFQSPVYEGHALAEFNFVEYRIGHDRHRFTMFVFAGLGVSYTSPVSDIGRGYAEGQGAMVENGRGRYSKYQMCVPFGVGIKFNVGEKTGIGFEWGPRKLFTDYLDDVSGTYNEAAIGLHPGTGETVSYSRAAGNMRGNPNTRDWYFFYGVTLTFKLKDSKRPCHAYL